jgi:molybdopterin-containing oxidoreductase family membrane subunit
MWSSIGLMVLGIVLLVIPATRRNEAVLAVACVAVFVGTWIDKGLGMISGGFVPSPLHQVNEYVPSGPELMISLAVWATGFLVLTFLFKMAISVKEEVAA